MSNVENDELEQDICFRATGLEEVELLVTIAALGICRAVQLDLVDAETACRRLFNPALMRRLEAVGAHAALREAVHLGSELEDLAELAPQEVPGTIRTIEALLQQCIAPPRYRKDAEKWLLPAGR